MMLPLTEAGKTEGWKVVLGSWGKGTDGINEQRGPGDDRVKQRQSEAVTSEDSGRLGLNDARVGTSQYLGVLIGEREDSSAYLVGLI